MKVIISVNSDGVQTRKEWTKLTSEDSVIMEKIFNCCLVNRGWSISIDSHYVTLTFFDTDNCFGWTSRVAVAQFFKELYNNGRYLRPDLKI
jgi:hypothetical protein